MSDIYIVLIHSRPHLTIWREYLRTATDIEMCIISRESEDLEMRIDMVSSDVSRRTIGDILAIDHSSSEERHPLRQDESSLIVSVSLPEEHIRERYPWCCTDLDMGDLSQVEDDSISG